MQERCALCKSQARIYCDSDKAMLCWTCDAKVHSANFLVAKHCRCLLCHVCQSPTPWSASGEKLGRTVSVCDGCHRVKDEDDQVDSEGDYDADDNDEDEDETGDDVDLDAEDEEEENQVVPWSSITPPPSPSSSSSRDYRSRFCTSDDSKRMPDNFSDLSSDEDFECTSSQAADDEDEDEAEAEASPTDTCPNESTEADVDSIRPLKVRKMEAEQVFNVGVGHRCVALVESLNRLHQQDINPGSRF